MICFINKKMKDMKNIVKSLCVAIVLLSFAGCNPYETWPIGLPELEHVYYVSNVKTGNGTETDLQHEIAANGTARFLYRYHKNPNNPEHTPLPATEWRYSEVANETMPMDFRFVSEHIRSYDVVTFFWVETRSGNLADGTDFTVHLENGTRLTPNAEGAYSLTWPKAEKSQQAVKIRRISSTVGEVRVMFLYRPRIKWLIEATDRVNRDDLDVTLLNNKTSDYTVRGFWHDYAFPVVVRFQ